MPVMAVLKDDLLLAICQGGCHQGCHRFCWREMEPLIASLLVEEDTP